MGLKLHETLTTLGSAISDGYATLQELRDEVREAYDNMPESLQSGERGSALDETASSLDNEVDGDPADELPEYYADVQITYGSNRRKRQSRSDRRDQAVRMLEAAESRLQDLCADLEDQMVDDEENARGELDETKRTLEDVAERVRSCIDVATSVEFPGMYG